MRDQTVNRGRDQTVDRCGYKSIDGVIVDGTVVMGTRLDNGNILKRGYILQQWCSRGVTHLGDESIDVHGFLLSDTMHPSHGLDVHLKEAEVCWREWVRGCVRGGCERVSEVGESHGLNVQLRGEGG